ncbi:metallophosphoesterase [Longispora sp. NPDC051575]|uniref:metallophosphoesterase family protein n=1 Tax=Longispora sp. NPDC051575 TaxID=3154943 RepID=UPI00342241D7
MKATIFRRALVVGALLLTTAVATVAAAGPAPRACGESGGVTVCISVPSDTLTGDVPVTATIEGKTPYDLVFTWESDDLLFDFQPPWTFVWPTDRFPNGPGRLGVSVKPHSAELGEAVLLPLTIDNPPRAGAPDDWQQRFAPRQFDGDPLIAAVGDGGDGTRASAAVAQSVLDSRAGLLLFLGDVYETGTAAEWDYNYGRSSLDDPAGGRDWGRLAAFTKPTLGNHEAHHLDAWRDYWHGRPDYETFAWRGVRFLVLNSECGVAGGCGPRSPQYKWAEQVLRDSPERCVIATWHRPLMGPIPHEKMSDLWALLADNGGDLVLNGHQHDMEEYEPLTGDLRPGGHLVQLIAGSGGHIPHDDPMPPHGIWQASDQPGALYVQARGDRLDWAYRDPAGQVVTDPGGVPGTGSVTC